MNTIYNRGDWKILKSDVTYENPWIKITHYDVITPGGTEGIYGEVGFKNKAIGILPIEENGYTWIVGQHRFPLDRYSWEIPEGGGPLNADPLDSAKRELREEVGLEAKKWELLLEMDLSNSVSNEEAIVFVARDFVEVPTEHEDTENLTIEKLHFSKLYERVITGEIRDSISVAAVLKLAALHPDLITNRALTQDKI